MRSEGEIHINTDRHTPKPAVPIVTKPKPVSFCIAKEKIQQHQS